MRAQHRSAVRVAGPAGPRCTAVLVALALAACQGDEAEEPTAPEADVAEAPPEAREAVRAEALEAPIRPRLGTAERRAIDQARGADEEQDGPEERAEPPSELTEEERLAAADDPAARRGGLEDTPPAPEARPDEPERRGPADEPEADEADEAALADDPAARLDVEPDPEPEAPAEDGDGGAADVEEVRPGARLWPGPGDLRLVDLAIATGVRERTPENVSVHYEEMPDLFYCFNAFDNPEEPVTVTHVWRRGDRVVSRVELEVGVSARWRTWSRQRVKPSWTGDWSCEVLAPGGERLGLARVSAGE